MAKFNFNLNLFVVAFLMAAILCHAQDPIDLDDENETPSGNKKESQDNLDANNEEIPYQPNLPEDNNQESSDIHNQGINLPLDEQQQPEETKEEGNPDVQPTENKKNNFMDYYNYRLNELHKFFSNLNVRPFSFGSFGRQHDDKGGINQIESPENADSQKYNYNRMFPINAN